MWSASPTPWDCPCQGLTRVFVTQGVQTPDPNSTDSIWVEAEAGEVGQLFVRGPNVMQGYLSADGSTSTPIWTGAYRDDVWLATGDLFYRDDEGYFYFVSRQKDLIKQDGFGIRHDEDPAIQALDASIEAVCASADVDFDGIEIAHAFIKLSKVVRRRNSEFGPRLQQIKQAVAP